MTASAQWGDLKVRILSGLVVLGLGLGMIWSGGTPVRLLGILATGAMLWELARMQTRAATAEPIALGLLAAAVMAVVLWWHDSGWVLLLPLPALLLGWRRSRDRVIIGCYGLLVMVAVYGFVGLREGVGLPITLWLVLVVVASDVMGYFGGRLIGGPKFWPRVSPKKTWSGTVAGWVGAGLVGLGFVAVYGQPLSLIALSALTALAAQMGDIAESALKRRAGIKDSSNLIPGHGGALDRFDALIGAAAFVLLCFGLGVPAFQSFIAQG